jgi:hypothetical protein
MVIFWIIIFIGRGEEVAQINVGLFTMRKSYG